jgi:hypothetical protein
VALDPKTGEVLWLFRFDEGQRGTLAPRQLPGHGVSYWTDGHEERILYVTPGNQVIALNARTGANIPTFGVNCHPCLRVRHTWRLAVDAVIHEPSSCPNSLVTGKNTGKIAVLWRKRPRPHGPPLQIHLTHVGAPPPKDLGRSGHNTAYFHVFLNFPMAPDC